jgi:bifunctional DNA-binding transcriptional regulator/antitoxin component of YhaV-PrlF toxin-antitoxin module
VEVVGRITLPDGARQVLGVDTVVRVVCRDLMLVLRRDGVGASVRIDRRGRLSIPAWLRQATQSSGSVLVAARSEATPTVVVAATGILDDLMDHVAAECR